MPHFIIELTHGLKEKTTTAEDMKKIVDAMNVIYNKKIAEKKAQ